MSVTMDEVMEAAGENLLASWQSGASELVMGLPMSDEDVFALESHMTTWAAMLIITHTVSPSDTLASLFHSAFAMGVTAERLRWEKEMMSK